MTGEYLHFCAVCGGEFYSDEWYLGARCVCPKCEEAQRQSRPTDAALRRAEDVAAHCYDNMFRSCTALTVAPELPATKLASYCYYSMFLGCSSLTAAPALPATTLADSCFYAMFYVCNSLREVEVAFSAWTPANATTNWLYGVSSTGTFRCSTALGTPPDGDNPITRSESNCPEGWTVVNTD